MSQISPGTYLYSWSTHFNFPEIHIKVGIPYFCLLDLAALTKGRSWPCIKVKDQERGMDVSILFRATPEKQQKEFKWFPPGNRS